MRVLCLYPSPIEGELEKIKAGEAPTDRLYGLVELPGKLGTTRDEVCRADVIVVPSCYGDACPSTVSEALASGRPLCRQRRGITLEARVRAGRRARVGRVTSWLAIRWLHSL